MKRVDPEANMDRWYMVFVQASLCLILWRLFTLGEVGEPGYYQMRVLPGRNQTARRFGSSPIRYREARK